MNPEVCPFFHRFESGCCLAHRNESSPTPLARLPGFEGTSGIPLALTLRWCDYNISGFKLHVNCLIVEIW
nr:MAG TPA_asm: hypothetical protein [Caudoviricetes sp.]